MTGDRARSAIDALVSFSFGGSQGRRDHASTTLLAIHDRLTGGSLSRGDGYPVDLGTARRTADRVSEALGRAAYFGHLRIERATPLHLGFVVDDAPDTVREEVEAAPASIPAQVADWIGVVIRDEDGAPISNVRCRITAPGRAPVDATTDASGRVLLIHHRRLGVWLPVGGEIEAGETPLEAARRELTEETGLDGRFEIALGVDGTPPGLLGYEEHRAGSKGLHMNFAFVADVDTDAVVPNDEVLDHRWVRDAGDLDAPTNVKELCRMALAAGASPLEAVARAWLDAFNGRDLDRLLALYDADAVHTSPKLRDRKPEALGEIRGHAALRAWWADAMQRLPSMRYEARHLVASGDRVFMEYERTVDGEPPMLVAEVLVCQGGRIVASRVYHG